MPRYNIIKRELQFKNSLVTQSIIHKLEWLDDMRGMMGGERGEGWKKVCLKAVYLIKRLVFKMKFCVIF